MRGVALLVSLALAIVATFPARATTVPDSRGSWNKAAVPIELRGRVHTSVREVPRFPEDDPKLAQLKNWPKKRQIGDWDCELEVTNMCAYGRSTRLTTSARYLCHRRWWPWGKPQVRGPVYIWSSDGQLLERATAGLVYETDRAGRLVMFEDRKHGSYEYFDADGVLIAGEYAPVGLDKLLDGERREVVSVWLGDRVSHDEFIRRLRERNRDMESRY